MEVRWYVDEAGDYWFPFVFNDRPHEASVEWVYSADDSICWIAYVRSCDGVLFEQMALTAEDAADMALGFIENEL